MTTTHYETNPRVNVGDVGALTRRTDIPGDAWQVRVISDMALERVPEPYLLEQTPRVVLDATISPEIPSWSVYRIHKIHFPTSTCLYPLRESSFSAVRRWNPCLEYAPSDYRGGIRRRLVDTMQKLTSSFAPPCARGFGFHTLISLIRWMILQKYSGDFRKFVRAKAREKRGKYWSPIAKFYRGMTRERKLVIYYISRKAKFSQLLIITFVAFLSRRGNILIYLMHCAVDLLLLMFIFAQRNLQRI